MTVRFTRAWVAQASALLLCAGIVLHAGYVEAQAPATPAPATAQEPAAYRALIDDAVTEYEGRRFVEARVLFAKANALYPNARALRGLGMAEFELRSYADAVAKLEQALASTVKPLEGDLRAETVRLLDRAISFVARVTLTFEPETAQVLVDNAPVTVAQGGALLFEAGPHAIEVRAEGHTPEKIVRRFKGGEAESLRVVLVAATSPQVAPLDLTTTAEVPAKKKRLYKNPWLWTGVGVGVAALATGLAVGLSSGGGGGTREPIVGNPAGKIDGP